MCVRLHTCDNNVCDVSSSTNLPGQHQMAALDGSSTFHERTWTAGTQRIFHTQSGRKILNNKYHTNNEWASGCSCLEGIISNFLPMFHIPTPSCSYSLWLKSSLLSTSLIYFSNQHVNLGGRRLLRTSVNKLWLTDRWTDRSRMLSTLCLCGKTTFVSSHNHTHNLVSKGKTRLLWIHF